MVYSEDARRVKVYYPLSSEICIEVETILKNMDNHPTELRHVTRAFVSIEDVLNINALIIMSANKYVASEFEGVIELILDNLFDVFKDFNNEKA